MMNHVQSECMPQVTLSTRQYTELMRSIMVAMTVDDHVAILDGRPPDSDIEDLWNHCMDAAEDFGMSFPRDEDLSAHWSHDMAQEADEDVHVLLEAECWPEGPDHG